MSANIEDNVFPVASQTAPVGFRVAL